MMGFRDVAMSARGRFSGSRLWKWFSARTPRISRTANEFWNGFRMVTLPAGLVPQMGRDWSPVGQIYFYTLESKNPAYDVMELKSLEDWVIEKNLKSVPGVVDTNPFGGPTREYQVRLDPDKLVSYGLSIAQVEQQLTNNNANAGGSFIEAGLQQINVREVGLVRNIQDIENTVIMTKNGTALRVKDIAVVAQGPKIRLGQFGRAYPPRRWKDHRQRRCGFRYRAAAEGCGCGAGAGRHPQEGTGTQ